MTTPKKIIVIVGPTAVGKTAFAIKIARHFKTAIISADSRQCYSELNIGVARPSVEELAAVPHYFVASHSIKNTVTAIDFENYALAIAEKLFKQNDTVVMVGGTGLYIKAFCEGLDTIPTIDAAIREKIISQYKAEGIAWLQEEIKIKDPLFFAEGEMQNPQRMMRALEVAEATGKSIQTFKKGDKVNRPFAIYKVGLELPKDELQLRISKRVDAMMQAGLLDEVKSLLAYQHLNALQTVGYTELFDYLNNKQSLKEAAELVKIRTRQYAKRQMTWFKKDENIRWVTPNDGDQLVRLIEQQID